MPQKERDGDRRGQTTQKRNRNKVTLRDTMNNR